MTTIAFKDGIMACDSKVTEGDFFVTRCPRKVFRLKWGHLLGQSGDADERDLVTLLNSVRSVNSLPSRKALAELKMEFNCLLALKNGRLFNVYCGAWADAPDSDTLYQAQITECHERFASVGNGHQFALGAMAAGVSAKRAVEIACKYDSCSGPPVRVYKLKGESDDRRPNGVQG